MAQEAAGQTLQATALVHEAWLRWWARASEPGRIGRIFFGAGRGSDAADSNRKRPA